MKRPLFCGAMALVIALMSLGAARLYSAASEKDELLQAREAVWRAWFAGDQAGLERLVPPDAIAISAGEEEWKSQKEIIQSANDFHAAGGKLLRLDFPRTEIQRYGDVAIVYSQYLLETEMKGKRSIEAGRATETFVLRDGKWINPGWHTDSGK